MLPIEVNMVIDRTDQPESVLCSSEEWILRYTSNSCLNWAVCNGSVFDCNY